MGGSKCIETKILNWNYKVMVTECSVIFWYLLYNFKW